MSLRTLILKTLSTFFYIGYLPLIPGTFASLAGLFLFYMLKNNNFILLFSTAGLTILGFLVAGEAEKIIGKKDPRCIVIDEVAGMLLSLLFIPCDVRFIAAAFILFRILDALKPFPAGALQKLKGSAGIMSDDIVAAIYANVMVQIIVLVS
jgi:phosphatidylglycerophosphatase A